MTQVVIDDIIPRTQLIASGSQTVFNTNWTADATTDIDVYARADGVDADDITQLVSPSLYTVTFIGASETVRVTFLSGRVLNDVITIVRNTPAERMNLYINTNFVPSMLNEDFGILTLVDQQAQMYDTVVNPRYNVSATIDDPIDTVLPILDANQIWAMNPTRTEIIPYDVPSGGGLAPADAKYLLQQVDSDLPNAQSMGALASGFVVNTTTSGIQLTRVLTEISDQTAINNGSGISGNPTIGIATNPIIPGNEGMGIPTGTTAQRPVSHSGTDFRFNSDLIILEYWDGSNWAQISETDGVVTAQGTANQVLVNGTSGSPIDGAIILTLPQDIATTSVPTFSGVKTASIQNATGLDIVQFVGGASVVNNFRLTAANTLVGPTISTVGSDTNIPMNFLTAGTGLFNLSSLSSSPLTITSGTAYQHTTTFTFSDTAASRTVTFQDANGTVAYLSDVAATVTSAQGTANQVLVNGTSGTPQTGAVIFTLPQSIQTNSAVQFGTITAGAGQINSGTSSGASVQGVLHLYSAGTSLGSFTLKAGTNAGNFENVLINTGTSAARTWTLPDTTGTIALTSGASGIVNSGTINQLTWYAATGTTVSGLATANNGLLVTSGAGVPSIGNTIGADITINGVKVGQGAFASATDTVVGASAGASNASATNLTAIGALAFTSLASGNDNTGIGYAVGTATGAGSAITTGSANTLLGSRSGVNNAATIGAIAIGTAAVADIATGVTSADLSAGLSIGSASFPVGVAGDASIIQTAGASAGYMRFKLNGTYYKFMIFADS